MFGSNAGQYTLQSAHQKWNEIKQWSIQEDRDPGDYWKKKRQEIESQKTLRDAVEAFLHLKAHTVKPTTLKEYRLKLTNQVMGIIPPETPLRHLEWDQGGRRVVDQAIDQIATGQNTTWHGDAKSYSFRFLICVSANNGWKEGRTLP